MRQATNIPYVKEYDENGEISNFPAEGIRSDGSNRRNRKTVVSRFKSNKKQPRSKAKKKPHMTVTGNERFLRILQNVGDKTILHYSRV